MSGHYTIPPTWIGGTHNAHRSIAEILRAPDVKPFQPGNAHLPAVNHHDFPRGDGVTVTLELNHFKLILLAMIFGL